MLKRTFDCHSVKEPRDLRLRNSVGLAFEFDAIFFVDQFIIWRLVLMPERHSCAHTIEVKKSICR